MAVNPLIKKLVEQTAAKQLTAAELFKRYLDAPVRIGATGSALIADCGLEYTTARDWLLQHGHSNFTPPHYAEAILDLIENDDDPSAELDQVICDLTELVEVLTVMKRDFDRLAEVTRTMEPDEDSSAEDYRDWSENPRYVLPVASLRAEAA